MTMAISKAVEHGAKAVICASTGNTSASAAAYATHAGITAAVLVPEGKIAMGKLSQAIAHDAELLQVQRQLRRLPRHRARARRRTTRCTSSTRSTTTASRARRRPRSRSSRCWATRPTSTSSPSATPATTPPTAAATREELASGRAPSVRGCSDSRPRAARRIVIGEIVKNPDTIASAIRIGNPASWELALAARDDSDGYFGAIGDAPSSTPTASSRAEVGIFVEPASAISVAGLLERADAGADPEGLHRGAHGHRPRPEGPAVGAQVRRRRRHHADRRRHRHGRDRRRARGLSAT